MEIGFCTMEKVANRGLNSVGSSRIRARWVAKYWEGAEEWIIGKKYDVLIFQKAWWDWMIDNFEGIKIFDICDPDWLDGKKPYFGLMSKCDAVVCNTQAMADYIGKLITQIPVICIPDRIDIEEHKEFKKRHEQMVTSAIWFGYSHNFKYVEKTFEYLLKRNIKLTVVSNQSLQVASQYGNLELKNVKYNYRIINQEIIKHDIVLMPSTTEDIKGRYKSNNKVLTSWALGMPVVQEPEDFNNFASIESRRKEGLARRKEVLEKWDVRISVKEYKDLINVIKSRKK